MGRKRTAVRILVRKPDQERPLGRYKHKWEDNIEMNLKLLWVLWTGFIWLRIATSRERL
jgi:hypothetical protein